MKDYTLQCARDVVYTCPRELEDFEIRSLYLGGLRCEYQSLRSNQNLKTFTQLREAAEAKDAPPHIRRSAVREFPPRCGRTSYHHGESSQARPVAMEEDSKEEEEDPAEEDAEEDSDEDPETMGGVAALDRNGLSASVFFLFLLILQNITSNPPLAKKAFRLQELNPKLRDTSLRVCDKLKVHKFIMTQIQTSHDWRHQYNKNEHTKSEFRVQSQKTLQW